MKSTLKILTMVLLVTSISGCYPEGPEYYEDLDLVFTGYDNQFPFSGRNTYSMPDQIVKITGDPAEAEFIKDIYAVPMLNEIEMNMSARGWTRVDENADVELLPAVWTSTTVVVTGGYYGGYWCWYNPYYCGGGWYYPYPATASYTSGTFAMVMTDELELSADDSKRVVWTMAINGLMSGTYDVNRVNNAIDQAFKQSPYLTIN
jgi:predicted small lipoprotein YifL